MFEALNRLALTLKVLWSRHTPEGGRGFFAVNKTGAPSIKGTLVSASLTTDFGVETCIANGFDAIGVIYEDGIADGDLVLVVDDGFVDVLLEDTTASTNGYWVRTSTTQPGRADATNAAPPGLVLTHFAEIGHCFQSVTAGVNKLARVKLHFN